MFIRFVDIIKALTHVVLHPAISFCFITLIITTLNISFVQSVSAHRFNNSLKTEAVRVEQVKETEKYSVLFLYYTIGDSGYVDFSAQIKKSSSGDYYNKGVKFQIEDSKGVKRKQYQPFVDAENNFKMRDMVEIGTQYSFIVQFNNEGVDNEFIFPFEIEKVDRTNFCSWCGMSIKGGESIHYLTTDKGEVLKTCCIHCAVDVKNSGKEEIASIETADHSSGKRFDIVNGWFVENSEEIIKNSMPPFIFPFLSLKDANGFKAKYGGDIVDYRSLEKEINSKWDTEFSSNEIEDFILLEDLFYKIQKNYYKDMSIKSMVDISIDAVMKSLDKDSSLKGLKPSSLEFIRGFERDETISDVKVINDKTGYLKINYFGRRCKEDFRKAKESLLLKKIDSLIIDLRDNPGGSIDEAVEIIQNFIPDNSVIVTVKLREGEKEYLSQTEEKWDYPLAILINSGTASSAEMFAATLRHYKKAVIVGENSYGKSTIQRVHPLNNELILSLTAGRYYLPEGKAIPVKGIDPDIRVDGEKEQVLKAVNVLRDKVK